MIKRTCVNNHIVTDRRRMTFDHRTKKMVRQSTRRADNHDYAITMRTTRCSTKAQTCTLYGVRYRESNDQQTTCGVDGASSECRVRAHLSDVLPNIEYLTFSLKSALSKPNLSIVSRRRCITFPDILLRFKSDR